MKKYIYDLILGIAAGILFFFASFIGTGGLIGVEVLSGIFPNSLVGLFLIGVPYALCIGGVILIIKRILTRNNQLRIHSYFIYSVGVYLVYVVIALLFLEALSRGNYGL